MRYFWGMISSEYRILEAISEKRRFGAVYLGEHKESGRKVVIKTAVKGSRGDIAVMRLKSEAEFSFDQVGLPKVLKLFEDDSNVFIISEFLTGIPLDQYWKSIKKKDLLSTLIEIMYALKEKLELIHEMGIYHLDLKPGNILVDQSQDGKIQIKLIDFGLALKKDLNEDRSLLFPLGYAPPEVILNQLDLVDERSDYFSLGILIWTLLAGHLPLTHPNPSIFTNLQLTHPLPEHNAISKKLYRILKQMTYKTQFKVSPNRMPLNEVRTELRKGMEGRYSDLKQVIADLEEIHRSKKSFYQRMSFLKPRLNPNVKG